MWARTVRRLLRELAVLGNYRRVQCHVAPDFPEAVRLVEWLGFKYESTAEKYGPQGQTLLRYVYFPEVSNG